MAGITGHHLRAFAAEVTRGLGIPRASARIIEVLALRRRRLGFRELAARAGMSDRSLRGHLKVLVARGVLQRKVVTTPARRLAYEYCTAPLADLLRMVRRELAGRAFRLQRLGAEMGARRRAPA